MQCNAIPKCQSVILFSLLCAPSRPSENGSCSGNAAEGGILSDGSPPCICDYFISLFQFWRSCPENKFAFNVYDKPMGSWVVAGLPNSFCVLALDW